MSWVGGAEWFGGRVDPMAEDSRRPESAIDCRIDPMSDHYPLLVAEPLDGERLVNSQLRPRAGNRNWSAGLQRGAVTKTFRRDLASTYVIGTQ